EQDGVEIAETAAERGTVITGRGSLHAVLNFRQQTATGNWGAGKPASTREIGGKAMHLMLISQAAAAPGGTAAKRRASVLGNPGPAG
ncbi:MAG: hypothetical protein ACREFK_16300, partial [Stellaceae bacterium]